MFLVQFLFYVNSSGLYIYKNTMTRRRLFMHAVVPIIRNPAVRVEHPAN